MNLVCPAAMLQSVLVAGRALRGGLDRCGCEKVPEGDVTMAMRDCDKDGGKVNPTNSRRPLQH